MGNTGSQLTYSSQALLLHHALLRIPQFLQRLFELMMVDETVMDMILARAMAYELREYARKKQGMRTLREEGLIKSVRGITSAEEIL